MSAWSTKVKVQGKTVNNGTKWFLEAADKILQNSPHYGEEKDDATLYQGGYNTAVSASAGTHRGGGTFDSTAFNWKNRIRVYRILGGVAYHRTAIKNVWVEHCHVGVNGDGTASKAEQQQWASYAAGRNALAGNGKDTDWRPHGLPIFFVDPTTSRGKIGTYYLKADQPLRTEPSSAADSRGTVKKGEKFTVVAIVKNGSGNLWAINIDGDCVPKDKVTLTKPSTKPPAKGAAVRVGSLNFPDKTKITTATEAARIKRAVVQINAADLDILGLQEGVGRKGEGKPSDLMVAVAKALGADWEIVTPTLDLNENYYLRRKATTNVTQHDDVVIRGSVGGAPISGRHVSLSTFETAIGDLTIGNTQLVNNNRPGAEVQAALAAKAVNTVGGKRLILGDFNTSGPLSGFTKNGLHNARFIAKAVTNRDAVTYTNQHKTRPSTNPYWLIDGIWVSDGIEVNGYTAVLDLDDKGNFIQPRVSDHSLIIVSLS